MVAIPGAQFLITPTESGCARKRVPLSRGLEFSLFPMGNSQLNSTLVSGPGVIPPGTDHELCSEGKSSSATSPRQSKCIETSINYLIRSGHLISRLCSVGESET